MAHEITEPDFGIVEEYIELNDSNGYPIEYMAFDYRPVKPANKTPRNSKSLYPILEFKRVRITNNVEAYKLRAYKREKKRKEFEFWLKVSVIGWLATFGWWAIWRF